MVRDHGRSTVPGRRLRPARRIAQRLSGEAGQDVIEYAGLLVFVAAILAAFASLNLAGAITRSVPCAIKEITNGGCTLATVRVPGGSELGPARPSTPGGGALGEGQVERVLGSNRLIFACAGNGQSEVGADVAEQSQACKQQLAKLSPKAISTLQLLAALFQTEHDYTPGSGPPCTAAQAASLSPSCAPTRQQYFQTLLTEFMGCSGCAVVALSREAQQLQSGPILRNEKVESTSGDLWDGFLGSLCGGYGVCLGGTVLSQAYQQAYHASVRLAKITTPVLLATGVAGALRDVAGAGLKAVVARFGGGESQEMEQTVEELENQAENGAGGGGGGGSPPPAQGPGSWEPVNEGMSVRARAYQEQITGHPSAEGYIVGGVKFDGYRDGTLIDAKGPGYAWAVKDGRFIENYHGAQDLVDQARRQLAAAKGTPIEWDVAEPEAKEAIQNLLEDDGVTGITVRYVPPKP